PEAWCQAFEACQSGDEERLQAFEEAFKGFALGKDPHLSLRAALKEDGLCPNDKLEMEGQETFLFEYISSKKDIGRLLKAGPTAAPVPKPALSRGPEAGVDVAGLGGAVLDE